MLQAGYIDMTRKERIKLDTLLDSLGDPKVNVSRRDPGESGPLIVKLKDKDGRSSQRYEVTEDGWSEVTDG